MKETTEPVLDPDDICRACMKAEGILLPMYDGKLGSKNLPTKLAELASIQIDKFDGLPSKLCAKCAYRTDAFYDFKLQVQETEKKLRELFQADCYSQVKFEIASEDEKGYSKFESVEKFKEIPSREAELEDGEGASIKSEVTEDPRNCETEEETVLVNIVKDEGSISKPEDSEYAVVYVPEGSDSVQVPESQSYMLVNPGQENDNTDSLDSWVSDGKLVADSHAIIQQIKSKPMIFLTGKIIDGEESETTEERRDEGSSNFAELSEDGEDSDYFADSKDNILGSLNDTIIKIKEIKTGEDVINYQCTLCMQNYEELSGALSHIVNNHVPASGPFFCTVCEKDCENRRELKSHVKLHTGALPYVCFICQKAYAIKRYLKRHMVSHAEFYRHRCPKCGERFKLKVELESHVTSHIHGSPYTCSQCPRVFNHKGNYKRHLITHLDPQGLHLPKFPCKICNKRFLNNRTLETHMRVHTGEKPFKCNVCNKSFSQQGNLLNHMRIHSNPRSYTCEVCGKQFNQRSTLKDHSLLHTGEKPYVCTVCGIAFTFSAALRRHMWTHASGKPYGCEVCDARFVGKYDLKRHMGIHSDRPRSRRRRNQNKEEDLSLNEQREESNAIDGGTSGNTETILIEQVLLNEDGAQVVTQEESEKENVDALFTLIQYAE